MKTKSEEVFENFLTLNNVPFQRIEEVKEKASHRPDYLVQVGNSELIFEVKELTGAFRGVPSIHIRSAIQGSRKQIKYGAERGVPSILLIYNRIDPVFQLSGTDDLDFRTAMYGELTILIDKNTGETSDMFQGSKNELQESKNTSFGAVGRLTDRGGKLTVTLFENVHSKVKVPYDLLPSCFQVKRFEISNEPLTFN